MKLPRDLSGTELIKLLCKHYGYGRVNQEAAISFSKRIRRESTAFPFPIMRSWRIGTLNAILKAVAKAQGVEKESILQRL